MLTLNTLIPLAGLLAASYLAWFVCTFLVRPELRPVHISWRSLRRISGYAYVEGQPHGRNARVS
jgi:hypothetical protein